MNNDQLLRIQESHSCGFRFSIETGYKPILPIGLLMMIGQIHYSCCFTFHLLLGDYHTSRSKRCALHHFYFMVFRMCFMKHLYVDYSTVLHFIILFAFHLHFGDYARPTPVQKRVREASPSSQGPNLSGESSWGLPKSSMVYVMEQRKNAMNMKIEGIPPFQVSPLNLNVKAHVFF